VPQKKPKPRRSGEVVVKVLPKDPLVARTHNLIPVDVKLRGVTPATGPTSARVAVIDYNADLDTRFAPATVLADGSGFKGIARLKPNDVLTSFTFHQVNVWAIIEQILGHLESEAALARPIPWASGLGRLLVLPHAGYQDNAFYDRSTGALHFFYFEGPDGNPVYTCLSHDIVAHELGHAVLDGLKPGYNEVCSAETAGFHEYFGDAIAMLSALRNREIAQIVTEGTPAQLEPKNLVSAIASEFGAAVHGLEKQDYLRGAWNRRTLTELRKEKNQEEHDWSEVLTGVYYDLLQYLYSRNLNPPDDDAEPEFTVPSGAPAGGNRQSDAIRALYIAATSTANVMLRALDYCPPVDLRYDEYARALLRADEVAYPVDNIGIRKELKRILAARGIAVPGNEHRQRSDIMYRLRSAPDIEEITATPADAYRFLDSYRTVFGIPADANLSVTSVYRTSKRALSGYRSPRERIIEFTWSEDVPLDGKKFGALSGSLMPLYCGGTLVFDSSGNFLHMALVLPSDTRREELRAYAAYLVEEGSIGVSDGIRGIGAPGLSQFPIRASLQGHRLVLDRNPALRHRRRGGH